MSQGLLYLPLQYPLHRVLYRCFVAQQNTQLFFERSQITLLTVGIGCPNRWFQGFYAPDGGEVFRNQFGFVYEKYKSREDFDYHRSTPHFKEFFETLEPIKDGEPEIGLYKEIA